MISVLLGLVITAAVTAVVFNQFNEGSRKAIIEQATSDITTVISSAKKIYGTANQYANVDTATAVQGAIVPSRLRVPGTNTAQNNYNGAITFAPATVTSTSDSLAIGWARIAREDCQDLILGVQSLARGITIGATQVKPNDGAINLANLATACDGAATVDASFTIGRN
jgi:type II secretory pathway pseudopilin PulG